jgi:tRNA (Thr-GGU) A37 N-methylase
LILRPIGAVESPLRERADAPRQGDEGTRIKVRDLEALDGTPVLDLKPVLGPREER